MRIIVRHEIVQEFASPARSTIQVMRLHPRICESQHVPSWTIDVDVDCRIRESQDAFGNLTQTLDAEGPLSKLTIVARGEVDTFDTAGVLRGEPERFPPEVFLRDTDLTEPDAALRKFAKEVVRPAKTELDKPHLLMRAVHDAMMLEAGDDVTPVSAAQAFRSEKGASWDLAHVFIAAARSVGVPARCVSGYLAVQDDESAEEPDLGGPLRAWAEAHVEGLGWIGFDPSICLCMHDGHVRLAAALDYMGAAPLRVSPLTPATRVVRVSATPAETMSQRQS